LKQRFVGIVRLTRYREYLGFVAVTTFLGVIAAQGPLGWPVLGVLVANWLAVGFAFMINDVEDAADDALDPAKVHRNPVSAGILSPRLAYAASFVIALLAAAVYAWLGRQPFMVGALCLLLGFFYSWRPVRLKAIPVADLISHCLMLAGLQFMAGYVTFSTELGPRFFLPFTFVMVMSMYGELYNEMRDLEGDRKAGVRHTASLLGPRVTNRLMVVLLITAIVTGLVAEFVYWIIPLWVIATVGALAFILLIWTMLRLRGGQSGIAAQAPFHKPLEIVAAIALGVQVLWPWVHSMAGLQLLPLLPSWLH
jgi:4-hydroxybenzoate polyprenyltransferase